MISKKPTPMTPEAFLNEMLSRGWSIDMLAARWDLSTRRIRQIISDKSRMTYYDDAIKSLPIVIKN